MQIEQSARTGWAYLRLIRHVITRIDCLSRDLIQPFGLTNLQALSLIMVYERPGITQAKLVKSLESDGATISTMLKRMDDKGLVKRERAEGNARAYALELTGEGLLLATALLAEFNKLAQAIEETIPTRNAPMIMDWLRAMLGIHDL